MFGVGMDETEATKGSGTSSPLPPPPPPPQQPDLNGIAVPKDVATYRWILILGVILTVFGSMGVGSAYFFSALIPDKSWQETYTFWEGLSGLIIVTFIVPFAVMGALMALVGSVLLSVWGERARRSRAGLPLSAKKPSLGVVRRFGGWLARTRVPFSLVVVGLLQIGETILLWGYQSGIEMPLHMPFAEYGQGPLAALPEDPLYLAIFAVAVWCISGARGGRIGVTVFQGYLLLHVLDWMRNGYLLVGSNGEIGVESNKVGLSAAIFACAFFLALSARTWRNE